MHVRRALLYMPGNEMKKISKAASLGVDCVCMDMEDGVALNRKEEARATIAEALRTLDFGDSERLVRINPVGSGLETIDLPAALAAQPDGIVIPKVDEADQIRWVSGQIDDYLSSHPRAGQMSIIALVESARGIVNLRQICSSSPRLEALIFGAEDLAGDIGAIRTPEAWEIFYARSAVVTHAAAFDLQAIDLVYVDFTDTAGLVEESLQGARLGFSGKQIIHPNQVEPVQTAFTPSQAAVAHAKRVMEAFNENQQAGFGAFALDGKMVDAPIVKAAERVLARARAAGKL